MNPLASGIHWLGHDSFRIEDEDLVIYIDPWRLKETSIKADLILITHDHQDHCSPADVAALQKGDTVIVTIAAAAKKLEGRIELIKPGDRLRVKGVDIEALPAYNVDKFRSPGNPFHPRESAYVGFLLAVGGRRIYHAGDTDHIPEMASIETDVALLPVSGTYVMTAAEALEAVKVIQPRLAIPMHVGEGIGSQADAEYFRDHASIPVELLPRE